MHDCFFNKSQDGSRRKEEDSSFRQIKKKKIHLHPINTWTYLVRKIPHRPLPDTSAPTKPHIQQIQQIGHWSNAFTSIQSMVPHLELPLTSRHCLSNLHDICQLQQSTVHTTKKFAMGFLFNPSWYEISVMSANCNGNIHLIQWH